MPTHNTKMPRQNTLKVLKAGGLCSIQDLGRPGCQHLGFSTGGAADEHAYLTANQLLGNKASAAALEITLGQLVLRAECDCTIAITGADCRACINEQPVANWQVQQLKAGDNLSFSLPTSGLHSYLAVSGGIDTPLWLGSRSQTLNEPGLAAGLGKIAVNCELPLTDTCFNPAPGQKQKTQQIKRNYASFYPPGILTARFIPHKLWFSLDNNTQQRFITTDYKISKDSNRMGYRLSSAAGLTVKDSEKDSGKNQTEIVLTGNLSRAVTFGTIQLPDFHHPIVLMKERQTIGGYPVIGAVMQTDLFRLSQKRPGESLRFVPVTLEQAQQQLAGFYRQRISPR
ncbi:biotin-dependent carboxyltransferase family protein [Thalassomonas haliotis]|uniref:Biotin-dependent carboxyltransferase family protein n=1 Tax=Thalassomonas haliotis TaxID=485448 RepID=A0ABY7VEN2_9GAMM|nr:biotin-dependent carboxyltransferase family protein [Thalassomonas haliotis]WDE11471.1 biotin-dependent carboxyltransferase family protein [Thalassomonas haliotis]